MSSAVHLKTLPPEINDEQLNGKHIGFNLEYSFEDVKCKPSKDSENNIILEIIQGFNIFNTHDTIPVYQLLSRSYYAIKNISELELKEIFKDSFQRLLIETAKDEVIKHHAHSVSVGHPDWTQKAHEAYQALLSL